MGSSFTEYRGKGFWTRDGQIQVWLYLLVREIDRLAGDVPPWLLELREEWRFQSTVGITGCVCAGLDDVATSADRVEALIDLSRRALAGLFAQGPRLTLEVRDSYATGGPDTLCIDRDVRIFGIVGEHFIELLRGRVETDAATSPCLWPADVPYA